MKRRPSLNSNLFVDSIVIPDRTEAEATWGLVTYAPDCMLYDPQLSDISDKLRISGFVGHELAHMVISFSTHVEAARELKFAT